MGRIKRASIWNSIIEYLGTAIGYINIIYLFPLACSSEEFGVTRLLLSVSILYAQVANLGVSRTIIKLFPLVSKLKKPYAGLLSYSLLTVLFTFIIISLAFIQFKPLVVASFAAESQGFVERYYLAIPMALFLLINSILESILQALKYTIFTNFLKTLFNRLLLTCGLILLYFKFIDFDQFILYFIGSYLVVTLFSVLYLRWIRKLSLSLDLPLHRRQFRSFTLSYMGFSALSVVSIIFINHIDKIMIGMLKSASETGIYAMAAYIGAVVLVPGRAIARITLPTISSMYRAKNMEGIEDIYQKSALYQMVLGGFVLGGILLSIHNIFEILPSDYDGGKWVIIWIGLSLLVNASMGANGQIITVSRHFRFDAIASGILLILTVSTNFIFIRLYGMDGAAFASFLTLAIYNLIKFEFLRRKMQMSPLSIKTLRALAILIVTCLAASFIPDIHSPLVSIILRSFIYSIAFGVSILVWPPSVEMRIMILQALNKVQTALRLKKI